MIKVFVYRNLHKNQWSVRALEGQHRGLVIAHAATVQLHSAEFKVSEAGRQRVLAEKQKNIHAGVAGYLTGIGGCTLRYGKIDTPRIGTQRRITSLPGAIGVTYNPYVYDSFVVRDTEEKITHADLTILDEHGKVYVFEQIEEEVV